MLTLYSEVCIQVVHDFRPVCTNVTVMMDSVKTETPHDRCVVIERTLDHVTSGIGQESTSI